MSDATTDGTTDSATDRPDQLEMIEDAATIAYGVYRRVDFDGIGPNRRFDDEFVTAIEAASFCETAMEFLQRLADEAEVRAIDSMDGDVRRIVRKYDGADGRVRSRRFLRTIRQHPAFVVDEMHHAHVGGQEGETND